MRSVVMSLLVALCLPAAARAASYAGKPTRQGGLTLSAAVQGQRVAFATGHGFAGRFWPGVNLGATVPGTQPGELAATRAEYDRWLRGIGALGARVVRVYTILRPAFYDALAAYDRRPPRVPLRFHPGLAAAADYFPSTFPYFPADGAWAPPRLLLSRPEIVPSTGQALPAQALDVSRLRWGRAPEAGGGDDRVLVAGRGPTLELRIPWGLLTYADPSSHLVTVPHPDGTVTTLKTGGIGLAVAAAGRPVQPAKPYRFAGWNRVRWHERRKAGWRAIARAFATAAR